MNQPEAIEFQDLLVSILPKEAMGEDYLHFNCLIGGGNHVGMQQHEDDLAIMNLQDAQDFYFKLGQLIEFMKSRR